MDLLIRELEVNKLDNLPEFDDSFIVSSRLIRSLSKINKRIEYTVEDVPSYEKSYLHNQCEDELAYSEYINNPHQIIYIEKTVHKNLHYNKFLAQFFYFMPFIKT